MSIIDESLLIVENICLPSVQLGREVIVDFFLPKHISDPVSLSLLFINDGQDMTTLGLSDILNNLYLNREIQPILCVAITAGKERKREYGVAAQPDYLNRGDKATNYSLFIIKELLPFVSQKYNLPTFKEIAFAGFSLGGLSAFDIVWNHSNVFSKAGIFSGALWWRSKDQNDSNYNDDTDRIMQQEIRKGNYTPGLQFFFQCGKLDEKKDRNQNGIIDAIDDTMDHMRELIKKGYSSEDIFYLELDDGSHDILTWSKAMPLFLKWGWGIHS